MTWCALPLQAIGQLNSEHKVVIIRVTEVPRGITRNNEIVIINEDGSSKVVPLKERGNSVAENLSIIQTTLNEYLNSGYSVLSTNQSIEEYILITTFYLMKE
jgi:hypothetical protein